MLATNTMAVINKTKKIKQELVTFVSSSLSNDSHSDPIRSRLIVICWLQEAILHGKTS